MRGKCLLVPNRRLLISRFLPQQSGRSADSSWHPSCFGMRDEIADQEALIQTFAQALRSRLPIDQAVAIHKQLLTLYKFNYPAWTLPVLYLHPDFDGNLSARMRTSRNYQEILFDEIEQPKASLRSLSNPGKVWSLRAGFARVGRRRGE